MTEFGVIPPQLDFSEIEHLDGGIVEDSFLEDHHPIGFSASTSDSLEYYIRGTEHWTEFSKSYFLFEGDIIGETAAGGKKAKEDPDFKIVQNFWHSLFSSVDVFVNDTPLSFNNLNYPYIAFIQNLVNLTSDQQKTSGPLCLWNKDNDSRKAQIIGDNKLCGLVQFKSPLLMCAKNLFSFCNVKIVLNRVANPAFFFTWNSTKDDAGYKFQITKAVFRVRRNKIKDSYHQFWEQKLNAGGFIRYHLKDCRIFVRTFAGVPSEIIEDNLCHNILPTKLFFGFVDGDAFMGKRI